MLNIQIYYLKRSHDVQKAERFFKERRIPYQAVDLSRHALGNRELQIFARQAGGIAALLDRSSTAVLSHPAAHMSDEGMIAEYLRDEPFLLRTPLVRNGQKATVGVDEDVWKQWVAAG